MYKIKKSISGSICIEKNNGNGNYLLIPEEPDNTDYQEYLKWVAEGNEPLPADEVSQ
jgi:hypothetical protein